MITARIEADSISPAGHRLVTWVLTYPRFIHAEFMTHRVFSRNAASSRAIPVNRFIEAVRDDPAIPIRWGANTRGMQANEDLPPEVALKAREAWLSARLSAIDATTSLMELGVHKQLANRILEPWMHMTVVASATEHENFFALRAHPAAQPEIHDLAVKMKELYETHTPTPLQPGEWHLPFVDHDERHQYPVAVLRRVSAARCARVSYVRHEQRRPLSEDDDLHKRLTESGHWSPLEHVATPMTSPEPSRSNFEGWLQYRKMFYGEDGRSRRVSV